MLDKKAFLMGYNGYKQELIKKAAPKITQYTPMSDAEKIKYQAMFDEIDKKYKAQQQPVGNNQNVQLQDIISNKDRAWRDIRNNNENNQNVQPSDFDEEKELADMEKLIADTDTDDKLLGSRDNYNVSKNKTNDFLDTKLDEPFLAGGRNYNVSKNKTNDFFDTKLDEPFLAGGRNYNVSKDKTNDFFNTDDKWATGRVVGDKRNSKGFNTRNTNIGSKIKTNFGTGLGAKKNKTNFGQMF